MGIPESHIRAFPPPDAAPAPLSERVRSLRLPGAAAAAPTGRSGRWFWLLGLLLLLLAGGGYYWRTQLATVASSDSVAPAAAVSSSSSSAEAAKPTGAAAPVAVEKGDSKGIVLRSKGYVTPRRRIQISPKVSGMIQKLNVQEGVRVKQGDVLAELENVDYASDAARAVALLAGAKQRLEELTTGFRPQEKAQAKAELQEAQATLTQAEADFKRATSMVKDNVIAPEQFDAVESRVVGSRRRVERLTQALSLMEEGPRKEKIEAARAEVQQLEAELRKAEWRLSNCTIRAPISGTILTKNAEEGNIVNPIAFNVSSSICDMADLSDLEIELSIQERDISVVFPGQKCEIEAEALRNRTFAGVVSRLMPIADRAMGAIKVRVKVAVPSGEEGILKPDMGVIVSFYSEKQQP